MPHDFEADAELLRTILSTAAHDLGGVTSALALRLDIVNAALPPADAVALRAVTEEARTIGRQLRRLRGPAGGSELAPARERTFQDWLALLERFGRPALGRGVQFTAEAGDGQLDQGSEHALTYALLALFRSVRETRGERTATVDVRGEGRDGEIEVTVCLRWSDTSTPLVQEDRWFQHARALIGERGMRWEVSGALDVRICTARRVSP